MNFRDAAILVLKQREKPLSAGEITRIALEEQNLISEGKTPERTMAATIYSDIAQYGAKSRFTKIDKGVFGLREWDDNSINITQSSKVRKPTFEILIETLLITQLKSDVPSEFEEAIKDAFIFLGFEGELIGGSGNTDVLLTANIGKQTYKVSVDGKTSKSGKIIDRQIDWISLQDHKAKNKADFVVIVGPSFADGNLQSRANQQEVSLFTTEFSK